MGSLTVLPLGSCYQQVSGMLPDCANISPELVPNAADVLPHMPTAHQPGTVHSPPSPNIKANSFRYLSFKIINSLNATQAFAYRAFELNLERQRPIT
jgi:hypothetical protein